MQLTLLDNGNLKLTPDTEELENLRRDSAEHEDFQSDVYMYSLLEYLICNSDYQWIQATEIGALTDAPILGIRDNARKATASDNTDYLFLAGVWDGATWVEDVTHAYAFMDYQIISVQERMLQDGYAIFINAL